MKAYQDHKRAKHINMWYYFMKEKAENRDFIPVYIPNENNMANLLTKLLLKDTIKNFVIDLDLCSLEDIREYIDIIN